MLRDVDVHAMCEVLLYGQRVGAAVHEAPEIHIADGKIIPTSHRSAKQYPTYLGMAAGEFLRVLPGVPNLVVSIHTLSLCLANDYHQRHVCVSAAWHGSASSVLLLTWFG